MAILLGLPVTNLPIFTINSEAQAEPGNILCCSTSREGYLGNVTSRGPAVSSDGRYVSSNGLAFTITEPSTAEPSPEPPSREEPEQDQATTWYLAEGCTNDGFETWVLIQNPGDSETKVNLTYMTETGEVDGPDITLPPNTRKTVDVSATVPDTWSVSTMVNSDQPVICERAMYWNDREGGHDSVGFMEKEVRLRLNPRKECLFFLP